MGAGLEVMACDSLAWAADPYLPGSLTALRVNSYGARDRGRAATAALQHPPVVLLGYARGADAGQSS